MGAVLSGVDFGFWILDFGVGQQLKSALLLSYTDSKTAKHGTPTLEI